MEASWLPALLLPAAALLLGVLLVALCLDCRNKGPLVSIPQTPVSDDYVRHVRDERRSDASVPCPSPSAGGSTHSNPSYENPGGGSLDSDGEETGYILVLPEDEVAPPPLSRASTMSSDVQHNYVNVGVSPADDNPDYVNVEPGSCFSREMVAPFLAAGDDSEDEDDSDDDEQGNYVNQPTMIGDEPAV